MPIYCMSCKQLVPYWQCAKHLCKCQNKSPNNLDHWKKCTLKKVQKLKKKVWFRVGLNPQLSWLTTFYLHGFDRNVPQLFFVFSLHLCLKRTVKNEQKQISISNHYSRVLRWCAFDFAQVPFWCVLGMPSNSAIKAGLQKNVYGKKIFEKKVLTAWQTDRQDFGFIYILASVPALCAGLLRIKQYISIVTTNSSVLYVYIGVHSSMFSVLTMK